MATPTASTLSTGTVVDGRYRIVRPLKEGGMGVVYEVRHEETGASLALKVMHPAKEGDPSLRDRFKLEWKLATGIASDHVARAFDAGVDDASGHPFLAMELLTGEDLDARIARDGPLAHAEIADLMQQLARALDRIHAAGIVHRDIRPANLFLTKRDDGSPLLKVLDFGIAKRFVETTRTVEPTLIAGSPPYMPPEQLAGDGDIGAAADNYALAHVAFTLLVGTPYWDDESKRRGLSGLLGVVRQGLVEPASVRAAKRGVVIGPAFDAWFAAASSPDVDARERSPIDLAADLRHALEADESLPAAVSSKPRAVRIRRYSAVALSTLVAFGATAFWVHSSHGERPASPAPRDPESTPLAPAPSTSAVEGVPVEPTQAAPLAPALLQPAETRHESAPRPAPKPAAPPTTALPAPAKSTDVWGRAVQ